MKNETIDYSKLSNVERMQRADDSWNNQDWDTFSLLHDEDCVVYWPGREADPTRGVHDHRLEAERFAVAFPDNQVHNRPYHMVFGEGDFSCFVTKFTGTFTGPFEQADGNIVQPTGESFEITFSTAARWRDGKIVEEYSSGTTPPS